MEKIEIQKYLCGQTATQASKALEKWLWETEGDRSYLKMMRYRVAGNAKDACTDIYYIGMQGDNCVARLWNGWGKHAGAAGNFGNFLIQEDYRGGGLSRRMLDLWYEDLMQRADRPIGLFCSAAHEWLIGYYGRYGFRRAFDSKDHIRLYMPLGNSPEDFAQLCEDYYQSAKQLRICPTSVQWRHEIDCLLHFALEAAGEDFGLPGAPSLEAVLMKPELGTAELLMTEKDRPVGWAFTPPGGVRQWQIHPAFCKQFKEIVG